MIIITFDVYNTKFGNIKTKLYNCNTQLNACNTKLDVYCTKLYVLEVKFNVELQNYHKWNGAGNEVTTFNTKFNNCNMIFVSATLHLRC